MRGNHFEPQHSSTFFSKDIIQHQLPACIVKVTTGDYDVGTLMYRYCVTKNFQSVFHQKHGAPRNIPIREAIEMLILE